MHYPTLREIETSREQIDVFKGYNHNLRIGDGEFYDMKNLSSDNYPILSPRLKRGVYATPTKPHGLISKDSLCYVDGEDFVIGEERISMGLADSHKTLISMGAYVIIMPDKKYINTVKRDGDGNLTDYGDIEASVSTTETVTFALCKIDGSETKAVAQDAAPSSPKDGDLWIDTSEKPHRLKQYSSTNATWTTIATTYVKISCTGIGVSFSEDDGVTIEGVEKYPDLNTSTIIHAKGDNYIVITGLIDEETTQNTAIKIARKMPNMDFIIESENRLWGCRYGEALNGEMVNEIYASKLGDFKNWNSFKGISTDSYAVTVGTDGPFTGAVTHLGYPLFFKENCLHKIYGNYPSNYQVQTTSCRGVQKGCEKSLAIVDEVLFYKARSAVCAYDGSLPQEMSTSLGDIAYKNAVGGVLGNKYYISMADISDVDDHYTLFVFDAKKGLWHKEDDTQATAFCNHKGELYYIDRADNQIKAAKGSVGVHETKPIRWEAITGLMGTDSPDKKYISRIDVRMSLNIDTRVVIYAEYDSSSAWEHLFTMAGVNLRSFAVPIKPKRCDHLRLRFDGYGDAKIFSICKTIEKGSDT